MNKHRSIAGVSGFLLFSFLLFALNPLWAADDEAGTVRSIPYIPPAMDEESESVIEEITEMINGRPYIEYLPGEDRQKVEQTMEKFKAWASELLKQHDKYKKDKKFDAIKEKIDLKITNLKKLLSKNPKQDTSLEIAKVTKELKSINNTLMEFKTLQTAEGGLTVLQGMEAKRLLLKRNEKQKRVKRLKVLASMDSKVDKEFVANEIGKLKIVKSMVKDYEERLYTEMNDAAKISDKLLYYQKLYEGSRIPEEEFNKIAKSLGGNSTDFMPNLPVKNYDKEEKIFLKELENL